MATNIITLLDSGLESLKSIGFAVQYFPNHINTANRITHGHDVLEANFIIRGTAIQRIADQERYCSPGTLGIIHYGQEHCLATDKTGIAVINIYMDPAHHALPSLPEELSAMAGSLFPPAAFAGMPPGLVSFLHFADPRPLGSLLRYCCDEQESMNIGYETALESAWQLFLIACARQALAQGVETLVANRSRWIPFENLRLKLEREFAARHRLTDWATQLGMSEAHLCRRFKTYTGLSPFEYLARCRVRAAMQALRTSDRKIMDIALSVGFSDIGYFNRKFRQLADDSPHQYRQRFRTVE